MRRHIFATISVVCSAFTVASAGMPWRPSIEDLSRESDLIVIGRVLAIQPSLITDPEGRRFGIAEIATSETVKGKSDNVIRVAVETPPRYDEKGFPIPLSSEWRYDLNAGDHEYLLFLSRPTIQGAVYFVPAHSGSGIIDLRPNHRNSESGAVENLRKILQKRK